MLDKSTLTKWSSDMKISSNKMEKMLIIDKSKKHICQSQKKKSTTSQWKDLAITLTL